MTEVPYSYLPATISEDARAMIGMMPDPNALPELPEPDDLASWEAVQQELATQGTYQQQPLLEKLKPTVREMVLGDVPVFEIKPERWAENGKALVYLHGGAYTFQSAESTLGSSALMATASGLPVISIDYTLAPRANWKQVTDEVVAVLEALRATDHEMENIAMFGDSAGGALAAGSVLKMRDLGLEMPAALVLWSPWSDITDVGDSYTTLKNAEPFYSYEKHLSRSALAYADIEDQTHPYVSPVYGDYSKGFPPTLIQGGSKEIFLSNFIRHYQALDKAGITVKLDLYEGMVHVFQAALVGTQESELAISKSAAFLIEHLGMKS